METAVSTAKAKKLILSGQAPAGLRVRGHLDLSGLSQAIVIPPGLQVLSLNLSNSRRLAPLPENLEISHLKLSGCLNLERLPAGLRCDWLELQETPITELPCDLQVAFKLDLESCTEIDAIPEGLSVQTLVVRGCSQLRFLPKRLSAGKLDISDCELVAWPDAAEVRLGSLLASNCPALRRLPAGIVLCNELDLSGSGIEALPEGMRLKSLKLEGCASLESFPQNLVVEHLEVDDCPRLARWPGPSQARIGHFELRNCPHLTSLPEGLRVGTKLEIEQAPIRSIPEGLELSDLSVSHASELESMPARLKASELSLTDCPKLASFGEPSAVEVRRFHLEGCPQLARLPEGIRITSDLRAVNSALVALPEGLKLGMITMTGSPRLTRMPVRLEVERLDVRDCASLADWPSPSQTTIGFLNLSGCRRVTRLPEGLRVTISIDVANTGLKELPPSMRKIMLRWSGVSVSERLAFHPEQLTSDEVLHEPNAEVRRVILERLGFEQFLARVNAQPIDTDRDAGGPRQLFRVPFSWPDENLVCLAVLCPSTGRRYVLRVPPTIETCRKAAAWIAGFDDPDAYQPAIET